MTNPLIISLVVSGLGMLMLFVAMVLLYGLMYGLTGFVKDHRQAEERGSRRTEGKESGKVGSRKREAAVIAIALAQAEQELSAVGTQKTEETVSAWWTLHHHRRLTGDRRRRGL